MHLIEFKICVVVCKGSSVVVSHQIFFVLNNLSMQTQKTTSHSAYDRLLIEFAHNEQALCWKLMVSVHAVYSMDSVYISILVQYVIKIMKNGKTKVLILVSTKTN